MNQVRGWLSGVAAGAIMLGFATVTAFGHSATAAEPVDAADVYKTRCQVCHAADGNSPLPNMSFADGVWKHGSSLKEVTNTITNGVPGTAMISWKSQLTPEEIAALAKYVRQFDKKLAGGGAKATKPGAKPKTGE
jgi:mono/diheme cytochrome c family protein